MLPIQLEAKLSRRAHAAYTVRGQSVKARHTRLYTSTLAAPLNPSCHQPRSTKQLDHPEPTTHHLLHII